MGTARHETGALLRAHLSAAARSGHRTSLCATCRLLERLARQQQPEDAEQAPLFTVPTPRSARRTAGKVPHRLPDRADR